MIMTERNWGETNFCAKFRLLFLNAHDMKGRGNFF